MPIVSVSLNKELLQAMDQLQKTAGYSGRSEMLRAGLRSLIAEHRELSQLSGEVAGVLLAMHPQDAEHAVTSIKHGFEDIITAQMHHNLQQKSCLEIFLLHGPAARTKEMVQTFRTCKQLSYVQFVES